MPQARTTGTRPDPAPAEEELDDLPPIDGDEVEEEGLEAEDLDEEPADGGDPMDDSTGEGDPLEEIEVAGSESGWLDDAGEADGLDVGAPETLGAEEESSTLLEGAEESDDDDELSFEGGVGGEADTLVGDAGEEGFADEEEDLREEDLPRLDSGQDDTESDDADPLATLPDDELSEEPRPAWDDRAWERVEEGVELAAAVEVVACGSPGPAGGLFVGGQGLWRLGRDGADGARVKGLVALEAAGLRAAARWLVVDGARLFVSTARYGVLASGDGGRSFREVNGWRPFVPPSDADGALEIVVAGAAVGPRSGGGLVWSGDGGASWSGVLPDYRFETIAGDAASGEIVALARELGATTVARGSGGKLVLGSTGVLPAGKIVALAADAGRIAVAFGRGVFRADERDGGEESPGAVATVPSWTRLDGTAGLTAMTFARGDGTLLVALHSEGEGRAWILEARAGAPAFTVAEMGDTGASANASPHEDGDEARVRALCWDAAAGVVWAAGAFGLIAWRPARH